MRCVCLAPITELPNCRIAEACILLDRRIAKHVCTIRRNSNHLINPAPQALAQGSDALSDSEAWMEQGAGLFHLEIRDWTTLDTGCSVGLGRCLCPGELCPGLRRYIAPLLRPPQIWPKKNSLNYH